MPRACGEGGTVRRSGRGIQAKALSSSCNIVCVVRDVFGVIKDLGPHRQPGHGLKVDGRGQRQDDCSVPVSSQTPALAIFIGKSDSMRTRSGSLADCEPGLRLPTGVHQVLDHDRLGVKGEHISGLHKSSLEAAKSLRLGDVSLHIVCDQGSANHLFLSPVRSINTEMTNQKTKAPGKNSHPVNS